MTGLRIVTVDGQHSSNIRREETFHENYRRSLCCGISCPSGGRSRADELGIVFQGKRRVCCTLSGECAAVPFVRDLDNCSWSPRQVGRTALLNAILRPDPASLPIAG